MKRSAWLFMFFSLSVYAVGCGGGDEGGDSTGQTDNSANDASAGDSSSGNSGFKATPGVLVPTSTLTDDSTADGTPTSDGTLTVDGGPKTVVPPPLDDVIEFTAPKIDDPFAIPDEPIKKDGKGAAKDG